MKEREGETEGATGRMEEKGGGKANVHQALQVQRGLRMRGENRRAQEGPWRPGGQGSRGLPGQQRVE